MPPDDETSASDPTPPAQWLDDATQALKRAARSNIVNLDRARFQRELRRIREATSQGDS